MDSKKSRSGSKKNNASKTRLVALGVIVALALIFFFADPEGFTDVLTQLTGSSGAESGEAQPSPESPIEPAATAAPSQTDAAPSDTRPADEGKLLEAYFLDVGQGDSIFFRSPDGKTMLIDASENKAYDTIDAFLQEQGVDTLDVVIATHPHSDHIGAMPKVIKNYTIGTFYMPDAVNDTAGYEKMLDALEEKNVDVRVIYADDTKDIEWDDSVTIDVLSPFEGVDYDLNNYSIVVRVKYGDTAVMCTGDAEKFAETEMLKRLSTELFRSTVLKMGHHGSSTSTSEAFFEAVAPEVCIISCGLDNDYGHPHRETLELLSNWGGEYYRTDEQGMIKVALDGKSYNVTTEK